MSTPSIATTSTSASIGSTAAHERPSVAETTPMPTPDRWLGLVDGPFGIVARCTSLIPFSQTSKEARKKFYKHEIFRYTGQGAIVRLYGELSDLSWPTLAETLIRELNQRKMTMTAAIRLRAVSWHN